MSSWKWLVILPVLAGLLVFGPIALERMNKPAEEPANTTDPIFQPGARNNPVLAPSVLEISGMLALVLAVAVGGIWVLRRVQNGQARAGEHEIQVKESRRVSPKRAMHLVRVCDRLLLLAESEQGLHLLRDLTPADEPAPGTQPVPVREPADDGAVPRDMLIPAEARPRKPGAFRDLLDRLG